MQSLNELFEHLPGETERRINTHNAAKLLGYRWSHNLRAFIDANLEHFLKFGPVLSRHQAQAEGVRGRARKYYWLNSEQFDLLVCLNCNTPEAIKIKSDLVRTRTALALAAQKLPVPEHLKENNVYYN